MKRICILVLLLVAAGITLPGTASAQLSAEPWLGPHTFSLTMELGGAAFTDFRNAQARPVFQTIGVSEFQRRVSARTSITVGAAATYWIGRGWGVRLGGAFIPTRFSVWNEEYAQQQLDLRPLNDEPSHAALGVWLGNGTLTFRFPHSFGRVLPYGMIGAGVVHYTVRDDNELPPEARFRFDDGSHTTAAAVIGLGATLPLQREGLLLDFQLTDHLTRTPLNDGGHGEQFKLSGVDVELVPADAQASDGITLTSNLRLTIGLTISVVGRR